MRHRISPATILSMLALFFSLAGAGVAATGYRISSIWQIAPSVRHQLRGAQGPRGIPGPQGVAAAADTYQGFDAVGFYYRFSATQTLTPAQPQATARVQCAAGDRVINGGFYGQNEIVTADELATVIPAEWNVVAHLDPSATTGSINAWAVCAIRGT